MMDWDKLTRTEQALLLGFLPLLGASTHAGAAFVAVLILHVAGLLVGVAARCMPARFDLSTRWAIFAALGFSAALLLTAASGFLLPVPGRLEPWLLMTGLTPLVFCGATERMTPSTRRGHFLRVSGYLMLFAVIREPLGSGTLFGQALWPDGIIPIGILGSSAGAYILLAAVALGDALRHNRPASPEAAA